MIADLQGPKHFDLKLYAQGKLAQQVNAAICQHFNSANVSYYFESCQTHRQIVSYAPTHYNPEGMWVCNCSHHRVVWCGPNIISFIRRVQGYSRKYNDAPVLFATPFQTKGKIMALRKQYRDAWEKEDQAYHAVANYAVYETKYNNEVYHELYALKQQAFDKTEVIHRELNRVELWLGDVSSDGEMICCDPLWGHLWNLLSSRK